MAMELQKASFWKRISAWLFDNILLVTLTVLFALMLSALLGFDRQSEALEQVYTDYETRYGITFDISEEDYLALSEQEKKNYDDAYEALIKDEEMMYAYGMVMNLSLIITSVSILLAVAALEFAVPLLFKNGQTLGKQIFGIALIRDDGVRMNMMQLLTRVLLGRYTVGIMIPVLVFLMLIFNITGLFGTLLVLGLWLAQLLCLCFTRNKVGLADLMAGTVPVDLSSQKIFESTEDLIAYTKKLHAERAARQDY